jgi:hypothetical protein
MTWPGWVLVGLAGGYVALALYGKYRTWREEFHEAQEMEARRNPPEP